MSRSWSIPPRSRREAARTAGTPAHPTTSASCARIAELETQLGAPARPRLDPELEPLRRRGGAAGSKASRGPAPATRRSIATSTSRGVRGGAARSSAVRHRAASCLDGDLAFDCRVRGFEARFPIGSSRRDRRETWSRRPRAWRATGSSPSSTPSPSFLASRANEQIYNKATEGSKVIYACHYAGLIPAGPRKSHQSIRDISLLRLAART